MKVGIGKHNSDKDINLSTRGTIEALTVELVDANGNQVVSFGSAGLVTEAHSQRVFTYDVNNNITKIQYYSATNILVATVDFTYDANFNVISMIKT